MRLEGEVERLDEKIAQRKAVLRRLRKRIWVTTGFGMATVLAWFLLPMAYWAMVGWDWRYERKSMIQLRDRILTILDEGQATIDWAKAQIEAQHAMLKNEVGGSRARLEAMEQRLTGMDLRMDEAGRRDATLARMLELANPDAAWKQGMETPLEQYHTDLQRAK